MKFKNQEEAETKVTELEESIANSKKEFDKTKADFEEAKKEIKDVTRESMGRKDAIRKSDETLKKFQDVLKARGVEDFEGDIGEQLDKGSGKDESEKAIKSYERRMKQLEADNEQYKKDKTESDKKIAHSKFTDALSKQMNDIIGASDLIENMIIKERIKDDKGKIVCLNSEGDEFTVEKYVEDYKKKNPDRVKVQQQPGGGSATGNKGQNPGETGKTIKNSEYQAMVFDEKKKFLANPNNHIEE